VSEGGRAGEAGGPASPGADAQDAEDRLLASYRRMLERAIARLSSVDVRGVEPDLRPEPEA
jgi:hypothetical protein